MSEYMGQTRTAAYTINPDFKNPSNYLTGKYPFNQSYSNLNPTQRTKIDFSNTGTLPNRDLDYGDSGMIIPEKGTTAAWKEGNTQQYAKVDGSRCEAELMRAEAVRHCLEACEITSKNQMESTKKIGDRIHDVSYWKSEVEEELKLLEGDATSLKKMTTCCRKAIADIDEPLSVAEKCLGERRNRIGVDLVDDEVDKQLRLEIANFKSNRQMLQREVNAADNCLTDLEAIRRMLVSDIGDKFLALQQDKMAHKLNNFSPGLQFYPGIENIDGMSDPEAWIRFSHENILRSQAARANAKSAHASMGKALESHAESLKRQWNLVNQAFDERMKQYLDAKNKLESHLKKLIEEIADTRKVIEVIRKCLKDKNVPLKVAQTRIKIRSDRPNIENCRDDAHLRLVHEIHAIGGTVEELEARLQLAESMLEDLLERKAEVENELQIKTKSIFIDREACMGMRRSIAFQPKVACTCN